MDLVTYFERRERELNELGVLEDIDLRIASDGVSGTLEAISSLRADTELDAYVRAYERAVLQGPGRVHVEKYSYYLVVGGAEARGWEKDPTHDPAVHGHIGPDHKWTEAPEVSLREALELAWDEVQLAAETEEPD